MATILARPDGRFEIRESVARPGGPRSVTLAIFRELSTDVLRRAGHKATRPFDESAIKQRALGLGVPWIGPSGARDARRVLARIAQGDVPNSFVDALRASRPTGVGELPDTIPPMLQWLDKDDFARGEAVRDLMRFGDRIMRSGGRARSGPLTYPILAELRNAKIA
jgi:hypothetical protein